MLAVQKGFTITDRDHMRDRQAVATVWRGSCADISAQRRDAGRIGQ